MGLMFFCLQVVVAVSIVVFLVAGDVAGAPLKTCARLVSFYVLFVFLARNFKILNSLPDHVVNVTSSHVKNLG